MLGIRKIVKHVLFTSAHYFKVVQFKNLKNDLQTSIIKKSSKFEPFQDDIV